MRKHDQVQEVLMQIKPSADCDRVQFLNDCFSLSDVKIITAPRMEGRALYSFHVWLYGETKPLEYKFETKEKALKAQRLLARAYTRSGEFSVSSKTEEPTRLE